MNAIRRLSSKLSLSRVVGALTIVVATLVIQKPCQAYDLAPFKKRFEFVRNDEGQVEFVRDHSIVMNFSIRPYIQFIKESLQEEQKMMRNKSDYDYQIEALFGADAQTKNLVNGDEKSARDSRLIINSMRELEKIDFDAVFNDSKFQEVITNFESKMGDALLKLDPTVMAHLTDMDFFYKKRLTYQVLTWGLNFAKKKLSSIPVLNTVSYVLTKVEEMIRQRRIYHQNMLLHYLENYSEEELGLTAMDVNHIMSSIYESRIEWYAFWESNSAKANWDQYGTNSFYSTVRFYNNRLRRMRDVYQSIGERINYGYQVATTDKGEVILDMANTSNMFNSKLSVAYYYDSPKKVQRVRMVTQLAQLGLSFIPMGSFMKGLIDDYLDSFYRQQTLSEGALYGYFESMGDTEFITVLKKQVLNPFETL